MQRVVRGVDERLEEVAGERRVELAVALGHALLMVAELAHRDEGLDLV